MRGVFFIFHDYFHSTSSAGRAILGNMKKIVQDGASVLRDIAKPIPEKLFGSAELKRLVKDMTEVLDAFPEGVALAAPQIGVLYRLFIVRTDRAVNSKQPITNNPNVEVYINPEIIKTSRRRAKADEGCLSVHGVYGTTKRHERISIRARHPDGSRFTRGAGGLMAQIFEHEMDHLNGILFIDHAERLIRIPRDALHPFIYFGTPDFSIFVLDALAESGFIPAGIVTAPDKPAGRGLAITESPVKKWALERQIQVFQPESFTEVDIENLAAAGAEYAVVAAYGKILPKRVLDLFPRGALNVHPSLLPRYRGTSPVESQILADETETGVSVIQMDDKMDHGPIVAQKKISIPGWPMDRNTANEIFWKAGGILLTHILPSWLTNSKELKVQNESLATITKKITKEDGELDTNAPARGNYLKYLAYDGWPGTYFFENGKRMKITKASLVNGKFIVERVIPEGKRETAYRANKRL